MTSSVSLSMYSVLAAVLDSMQIARFQSCMFKEVLGALPLLSIMYDRTDIRLLDRCIASMCPGRQSICMLHCILRRTETYLAGVAHAWPSGPLWAPPRKACALHAFCADQDHAYCHVNQE